MSLFVSSIFMLWWNSNLNGILFILCWTGLHKGCTWLTLRFNIWYPTKLLKGCTRLHKVAHRFHGVPQGCTCDAPGLRTVINPSDQYSTVQLLYMLYNNDSSSESEAFVSLPSIYTKPSFLQEINIYSAHFWVATVM